MTDSKPCRDITQNKEECSRSSDMLYCGDAQFTAGDCVSLPCDGAQGDCSYITWLFNKKDTAAVVLVAQEKVKSEKDTKRLRVTETCSLEVKTLREEDEGRYTCRHFSSPGGNQYTDRVWYDLPLISTTTTRPTTTTVKANEIHPSTPKPTTTTVKARTTARTSTAARILTSTPNMTSNAEPPIELIVGLSLGIAAVLLVALMVLLIRWHRKRGSTTPEATTIHLCVDGDQDGGLTYASIVFPEGQRAVGTAQAEDLSVTYTTVRASSRVEDQSGDVDAPYATVIDTHNNIASG